MEAYMPKCLSLATGLIDRLYTDKQIADLSGIPLGTVRQIFSGEVENPCYDILLALEGFFAEKYEVKETAMYKRGRNGGYTLDDYYALPDERRVEPQPDGRHR